MSMMAMGGSRGMREDLSEITRSLARHLRAAADFLAPPPPSSSSPPSPIPTVPVGAGLRSGLAAISSLLGTPPDKQALQEDMGLSQDLLTFVGFLSSRPEEWVQCPVPLDDGFEMTEPRKKHIYAVERLVPSLASLRTRLCPSQISEGAFWKIYLFLLHPKLSPHHSRLLSTSQIVEEMDRALLDLRNRIIRRLEISRANTAATSATTSAAFPTTRQTSEIEEVDEGPGAATTAATTATRVTKVPDTRSWMDSIEWLEDIEAVPAETRKPFESEDEPMLSDFEGDLLIPGLRRPMSSSSVEVVQFSTACSSVEWAVQPGRRRRVKPQPARPPPSRYEQKTDGESSDWIDAAGDSDSTLG
ncbi:uncharacterized protein LOC144712743 [Wolffia australiana]